MTKLDIADRFADMWRRSRENSGKSQDYMAKALGVSKKTIQNWEHGTSCPTQALGFQWFTELGLQPLPYYLNVIYSEFDVVKEEPSDKHIEDALVRIIKDMPRTTQKKLLYTLSGLHGSSVIGIMEMVNAHLQSPLRDRLNIAQSVAMNYELARASGNIRRKEDVQPDMDFLYYAIAKGKEAVLSGKNEYTAELLKDKR